MVQSRASGLMMGIGLGIFDVVNSDFVSEGGDREFNGKGILIAIEDTEVRKRNPGKTREEVEAEYKRIYNLEKLYGCRSRCLKTTIIASRPLITRRTVRRYLA